jgi:hypothetical protein
MSEPVCQCGRATERCGCGLLTFCADTWDRARAIGVLGHHRPARLGGCPSVEALPPGAREGGRDGE